MRFRTIVMLLITNNEEGNHKGQKKCNEDED